jgi:DNA-binding beta-propeller fold protein YncE
MEFGHEGRCILRNPFSVALDADANVMVMDRPERRKYRVTLFSRDGQYLKTILECEHGSEPSQLKYPKGIAVDAAGKIYVPDAGNNRIQRFDADGTPLGPIGTVGTGPGEFDFPCDVEIDNVGALYVADSYNGRIQKLTAQGLSLLSIGTADELDEPSGVTVDEAGNIFVADTNHHRAVKYDPTGRLILAFGKEGTAGGEFSYPSDVRVTPNGMIYVADQENSRVQKFDAAGKFLSSFAAEPSDSTSGLGGGIAIDPDGYLLACRADLHSVARVELLDFQPPPPEARL